MTKAIPILPQFDYLICARSNAVNIVGEIIAYWRGQPLPQDFILMPPAGQPLESIQELHPELYELLKKHGWKEFPNLSYVSPSHTFGEYPTPSQSLSDLLHEIRETLEYYAHPDHYEESHTLSGIRKPGVLTEAGGFARTSLAHLEAFLQQEKLDVQ